MGPMHDSKHPPLMPYPTNPEDFTAPPPIESGPRSLKPTSCGSWAPEKPALCAFKPDPRRGGLRSEACAYCATVRSPTSITKATIVPAASTRPETGVPWGSSQVVTGQPVSSIVVAGGVARLAVRAEHLRDPVL